MLPVNLLAQLIVKTDFVMINALTYLIGLLLTVGVAGQLQPAYCTYHIYEAKTATSGLTCSDGANGLISWGYNDLSAMFPYVTAWQGLSWNNPKCGTCLRVVYNSKQIHITAVDQCGPSPVSGSQHFDISREAYVELFGDEGITKGNMNAQFEVVDSNNCKGNKKPAAKQTAPKPTMVTQTTTTTTPKVTTPPVATPTATVTTTPPVVTTPPVATNTPPVVTTNPPVTTPNVTEPIATSNATKPQVNPPVVSPPVVPSPASPASPPKSGSNTSVNPMPPVNSRSSPSSSESIMIIPYPPTSTSIQSDQFESNQFSFSSSLPAIRSVLNRFRQIF